MTERTGSDTRAERRTGALWLTLDRPEAFNAITPLMLSGLSEAIDVVEADRSIRALVITGSGSAFCAGADLLGLGSDASDGDRSHAVRALMMRCRQIFNRLEGLSVPTIAAVNGIALAGGLEMLLCCDIVVADEGARLGDGHSKLAQLPGGGGTVRLPRRIGMGRAKYLMFSGDALPARQMGEVRKIDADGNVVR